MEHSAFEDFFFAGRLIGNLRARLVPHVIIFIP